jgi:molybdate transport system substrate-binding protein
VKRNSVRWWVRISALLLVAAAGMTAFRAERKRSIEVMIGSAAEPPMKEICALFERTTGIKVLAHYGGSGALLAQIEVARRGDVYFPGSSDFMDKAVAKKVVRPQDPSVVVYLVPAITVQKGNPKGIHSLKDLARPDVRVGIGRPEAVCVGLYGVQVLESQGLLEAVRPHIVTEAESCEKTATIVSLGLVDASLGWRDFGNWDPARLETVLLPPAQVPRIATMTAASTIYAKDVSAAGKFVAFLTGDKARAIFRKWGYLPTLEEARKYATPETPVGGSVPLPKAWKDKP